MGERQELTAGPRRDNPSWGSVMGATVRLWFERRRHTDEPRSDSDSGSGPRRQRLIVVICAVVAMAFGAGVTLAVTGTGHSGSASARPSDAAQSTTPLQAAQANRAAAAGWIAQQVSRSVIVSCDPEMCADLEAKGFPASELLPLQPTATDPLGSGVVVATPAIKNQFGPRLASVYAPLVIASFGSGPEQVQVRYVPPEGTSAFDSQLASDAKTRVTAGQQLLANKNIQATPAASGDLTAGQVDPRLLVTLSLLAHEMPLKLVTFSDSSPGVRSGVPLREAEVGASGSASLSAILSFFAAQRTPYLPSVARIGTDASGQKVVIVQFDAPGPLGLGGS
jgi:hypothetical protein